jgi:glucose-1-phosphate thymidylyltransferase
MAVVLFEDSLVDRLYPITIGRPAFSVSCGGTRLIELVGRLGEQVHLVCRPHLRDVLVADCPDMVIGTPQAEGALLVINGRLVPRVSTMMRLQEWLADRRSGIVRADATVVAALLGPDLPRPPSDLDGVQLGKWLEGLSLPEREIELPVLDYPHDVVRHQPTVLLENLQDLIARGGYREVTDGVFAAPGATLGQYVVTDTTAGPIVLEAGADVGPYCFLSGPAHLGAGCRVIEHSAIKDAVALGHTTKVGGEVECSSIEPYTNKQHHGFLGHSYVGSWVNLGAGTCNSDLKNTYGQVTMEYDNGRVPTGMQFVGSIIGDYAKTAINTSIFTGKTIGACSMVYGFVTTNVPSFVNYARSFGQVTEAPVDVMIATQSRMFQRRGVEQRPCDIQLLHDMYELTRHERQIADRPLYL